MAWGQQAGCIQLTLCFSPQSPVAAKKEKKVSCMFIPDGRVSVSAQIDRKGFCEGRSLPGSRSEGGEARGGGMRFGGASGGVEAVRGDSNGHTPREKAGPS